MIRNEFFSAIIAYFITFLIVGCSSGVSESTQKEISSSVTKLQETTSNYEQLQNQINGGQEAFKKMLADSLGEQGLKFIEKDSLSRERIKSLENDFQNLKNDYDAFMTGYKTFTNELQEWNKQIGKGNQTEEEIREEWDSKQRQVQETKAQKQAYEQALDGLKKAYNDAITEIKQRMKK